MNDAESLLASRRTEWVIEWWISSFIILWPIEVSMLWDANFVVLVQANVSKLPAQFLVILSTPIGATPRQAGYVCDRNLFTSH
jgi:hypothetical protein